MPNSLQTCPDDIVESIVQLLSLKDICNLRLSCKSLAIKSSHHSFRTFFETKQVILVPSTLKTFVQGLRAQDLRSIVKNLHLVAFIDEVSDQDLRARTITREPEAWRPEQQHLLRQVFLELAKHAKAGISLTLRVGLDCNDDSIRPVPYPRLTTAIMSKQTLTVLESGILKRYTGRFPPKSTSTWNCAIDTFGMVMRELIATKLKIKSLNLFDDSGPGHHSLFCDRLDAFDWNGRDLVESLSTLQSLSVRMSTQPFPLRDIIQTATLRRRTLERRQNPRSESSFTGIANFVRHCPQLENLNIICNTPSLNSRIPRFTPESERILQHLNDLETLPVLKCLTICGICIKAEDLLKFIERTRICELSIERVGLTRGAWKPVLDYCISEQANMTKLTMDHLHESPTMGRIIHFGPEQAQDWISKPESRMELRGDELRHPITYLVAMGPHTGSPTPWQLEQAGNSLR